MTFQTGTILAKRYCIEAPLGSGGSGTVYRAFDRNSGRRCAIKHITETDPVVLDQVAVEAELLRQIRSAHVPRFLDHVNNLDVSGQVLVMEYVEGDDLETQMQRLGPMHERDALGYVAQILEALFHLHAQRPPIIHRDIKPANVRVDRFGNAWLLDLGIGQRAGATLTIGAKAVTLAYASPEQLRAAIPDARSDIYSLGAMLYHLLTNHEPPGALQREAGAALDGMYQGHCAISIGCRRLIEQAMALDPAARFQTAEEMHREVELLVDPRNQQAYDEADRLQRRISSHMPQAISGVHVLPAQRGMFGEPATPLPAPIRRALADRALFTHQVESIELIRAGHDLVVATGTGSGKTLCFNLPILERCLEDDRAHALYLYPTKALINDQAHALREFVAKMGTPAITVAQVHGDLRVDEEAAIRASPARIILSNPDKLHWMLAHWFDWRTLFSRLQFIVIDEVHEYRGVFGSHVAQVLRRLLRRCRLQEATPQVICASATIGNPAELVEKLIGRKVWVVDRNGAERSRRHVVFWTPIELGSNESRASRQGQQSLYNARRGASDDALLITERAVESAQQVITFARSRQQVERMLKAVRDGEPAKTPQQRAAFDAYRGGYRRQDRERIERELRNGRIRGVFSTNALELGIDIGGMTMAVLTGYPGSRMSFQQQAGRAGRRNQDGHVVFVASGNPLDHYFAQRQPDLLFGPAEAAVIDLDNELIAEQHLRCLAREDSLSKTDIERLLPAARSVFDRFINDRTLIEVLNYDGDKVWKYTGNDFPHRGVNIRGITDDAYVVKVDGQPDDLGELAPPYLHREGFRGAIYYYGGEAYLVVKRDDNARTIHVMPFGGNQFTRPILATKLQHLPVDATTKLPRSGCTCTFGEVDVTEVVTGYRTYRLRPQELLAEYMIDGPYYQMRSKGLIIDLDLPLIKELGNFVPSLLDFDPLRIALHGLEHLLLALIPTVALCDRRDLAGHFVEDFNARAEGKLTIYDAYAGGIGLSRVAFDKIVVLLEQAHDVIAKCPCVDGCPRCLHAGWCHWDNKALDKGATRELLRLLLNDP